jgi:thioredoxin reductase (NADPH)
MRKNMRRERVVIIGSGPAGLTAAIYTGRAQLKPVVIAGNLIGGQVALTSEVENYPGFPEGLSGAELVERLQQHAEKFEAEVVLDEVTEVDFTKGSPFTVKTHSEEFLADTVIVTIGANPRELKVPGEREFLGRGVSYCGTCDGFFFRGKPIVVVGGGDSALEESLFLTKFATSVNVIHRRDELRGGVQLQKRAFNNDKISFTWDSVVEEILGDGAVTGVRVRNVKTGEISEIPTEGVFIFIGHDPNSWLFEGQLETNDDGYLITDARKTTSVPGVFAAGEIQDQVWRQVSTSVGQGASAAMAAIHWLETHEDELQPQDAEVQPAG